MLISVLKDARHAAVRSPGDMQDAMSGDRCLLAPAFLPFCEMGNGMGQRHWFLLLT